jgi:hypothetical protein
LLLLLGLQHQPWQQQMQQMQQMPPAQRHQQLQENCDCQAHLDLQLLLLQLLHWQLPRLLLPVQRHLQERCGQHQVRLNLQQVGLLHSALPQLLQQLYVQQCCCPPDVHLHLSLLHLQCQLLPQQRRLQLLRQQQHQEARL